jgi:hypothetical protein
LLGRGRWGWGRYFSFPTLPQAMLSGLVVMVGCWTGVARCEGLAVSVSWEGVRGLKKGKSKSYDILSLEVTTRCFITFMDYSPIDAYTVN